MKLVSIIIPVYNTSKYLHKCLDSVARQSYTNLEIIIVDDGSTDESPKICDAYARADSRIKVIHQKNAGLVGARKAGVAACTGDYIMHVDSDDWIREDMCEKMLQKALETQSDVVWCDYLHVEGDRQLLSPNKFDPDPKQMLHNVLQGKFPWTIFNKLFKRDLGIAVINQNVIGDNHGEDMLATTACLLMNPRMSYVPEPLYYYNRNVEGSYVLHLNTLGKGLYAGRNNVEHIRKLLVDKSVFDEYKYDFCRLVMDVKVYLLLDGRITEARQYYPFAHEDKRAFNCFAKSVGWIYFGALNWDLWGGIMFKMYVIIKFLFRKKKAV